MSGRYPDRFHPSFGATSRSGSAGSVGSGGDGRARSRSPLGSMSELEQIQAELAEAERKLEMMKRQRRRPQPLPHPGHHAMRSPPPQQHQRHPSHGHVVSTPVHILSPSHHHHHQQQQQQQHLQQQQQQHVIISPKDRAFAHFSSSGADPLLAARAMAMAHAASPSAGHRLPSLPSTPDCGPRSAAHSPLRQHSAASSGGGSGSESPTYVRQLAANVQQRAAQIGHLQEELGSFLKALRPTIPPQYSWSAIPADHSHQLGAMLGLEDTVQHVLGASSPAARQSLERRYAQLAGSNKPLCQHCGSDHATFWRAFVDEAGRQVIVCEACDWRRVQTPFVQQYRKVVVAATAKAEVRRHEILHLVRLQQRDDRLLREEHGRLQARN